LFGAMAIALFVNLTALHADELSGIGAALARASDWERAERFQFRALALQPSQDVYLARLGQTEIDAVRSGAGDRMSRLERARDAYEAARGMSPHDPDHILQLALVESLWADASISADETPRHLETASDDLAAAARLAPFDPDVWNAWGKIRLRQHDFSNALALLERSLTLDDGSADTHLLYADALLGADLNERALQEYETAQRLASGKSLPAVSGKALALVKLNRVTEAIAANRQALQISPEDYTSRKNLALLYEQIGDVPQALSFAVAAAAVAKASEKMAIDAFVGELRTRLRDPPARDR
jgi:tetratricopeptide (TPR) repeat protein